MPGTTPNQPGYPAPPPYEPSSRVLEQEPNNPIFVGNYDFDAHWDDELSFHKGDLLYIKSTEKEDWWYARSQSTGKEGYIPSNYVTEWKSLDAEEYVNQFSYT